MTVKPLLIFDLASFVADIYGLNTVRYPVVQVTGEVKPFDNGAGFTLDVMRVERARIEPTGQRG